MLRNSSFSQRQTEGRPVPGLDHGPDGVIGLVDRQMVLLVLGGSLLLWQNMGSEGHRNSPRWVKIPFINHPAPLWRSYLASASAGSTTLVPQHQK